MRQGKIQLLRETQPDRWITIVDCGLFDFAAGRILNTRVEALELLIPHPLILCGLRQASGEAPRYY